MGHREAARHACTFRRRGHFRHCRRFGRSRRFGRRGRFAALRHGKAARHIHAFGHRETAGLRCGRRLRFAAAVSVAAPAHAAKAAHTAAHAAAHGTHIGKIQRVGAHLFAAAGQLIAHTLRTQFSVLLHGFNSQIKFLQRAESRGILRHVRREHRRHARDLIFKPAAGEILVNELLIHFMIGRDAFFAVKDPAHHRTVVARAAAHRRIDGRIDRALRAAALEGAKGQIVIPGDHGKHAVFFIQIIIVHHHAGVAVAVLQEVMHNEIADHRILIHSRQISRAELFQRFDQPRLIVLRHVCLGAGEDGVIAGRIIIHILQLGAAAAHAKAAEHAHIRHFHAFGPFKAARGHLAHIGHFAHIGHLAHVRHAAHIGHLTHVGHAAAKHLREVKAAEGLTLPIGSLSGVFLRSVFLFFFRLGHEIFHAEVASVAAAAAEVHGIGLIQFAVIAAVIAAQEALLHTLNGQIRAEGFAVHTDLHKAAQGRSHAHLAHQRVGQIILHVGVVVNEVIEAQLIQPVIGFARLIVVKLNFEAVAVVAVGRNGRKRGVSLAADGDVFVAFSVDHHRAGSIFLILAGFKEALPVVHHNIDGMHIALIKKPVFITDSVIRFDPSRARRSHISARRRQRQRQYQTADTLNVLMPQH